MFAYPVVDRDRERLVHELDVMAQMTPAKTPRTPVRARRILRLFPRALRVATAH